MIFVKRTHLNEYKTALSATLIMAAAGNSIGWTSPTLPLLSGEHSPIKITADHGSWINSIMILSSVVSAFPAAYLANVHGRKKVMLLGAAPYILGWLTVLFATTLYELYAARVLLGLGYGIIYTVAPMYLGEISSDEVRGSLNILITFMNKFGILMQYCIGPYVDMKTLAGINLCVPILFFLTFVWLAESPYYYVKEGRLADAENSLRRLRSTDSVADELKKIEATVAEDTKNRAKISDLFFNETNRRALLVTLALFATQQFCGSAAVITYAQTIFMQAEGSIKASDSSIILGFVQMTVAAVTVFLVDRVGRRPLLLGSSLGVCLMTGAIGTYFFFKDYVGSDMGYFGYFPVGIIVVYIVCYTIGLSTVPMAVTAEVFPTTVKPCATSVLQVFVGLSTFFVTKIFQVIVDQLGSYVMFWCFSACSLLGLVYIYAKLPETKGKSFSVIQSQLQNRRVTTSESDTSLS